jgi:UDPglucose--hexose-1-phosphate uridylyltransferase
MVAVNVESAGRFIFDDLTGLPTILAANRAKRTDQTGAVKSIKKDESKKEGEKVCFFCKGSEHLTPPTEYKDSDNWNVRVFKNKYPLLPDHEVVVHSPDHIRDIEDLSCEDNVKIIRAYLNRVSYYGQRDKEVIIFNNRGGKAGASILHPHSQIVAAKGFPGILEKEKEEALHYYNEHSSCYWCDEIWDVLNDHKERLVYESSHYVVYVPRACRWSYEMKLVPKNHKPNFGFIDDQEINDLAAILKGALNAYNTLFDRPDRNFWVHTLRYEPYHWHMGFIPHIKVFGALELGAGLWVSDKALPEDAAEKLASVFEYECVRT